MTGIAITAIICLTLTIWLILAVRLYYNLKVNQDFVTKAKDINTILHHFMYANCENWASNDGDNDKFIGKGKDVVKVIKLIESLLYNITRSK